MSKTARFFLIGGAVLIVGLCLAWILQPVAYLASAAQKREFDLQVSYDKFRTIMVRKNATKAIVTHGGMKLISDGVDGVKLDLSKDDRPILNAILGKSKAEVDATKMLTVQIKNDHIDTEQLTLRSHAQINGDRFHVESKSIGEQGQIKNYVTTISAAPQGNATHITLTLDMTIQINLPKMFSGQADKGVAKSAEQSLTEQQAAITDFIIKHADSKIVFPAMD